MFVRQASRLGIDNKKFVSLVPHRCLFIVKGHRVASNAREVLHGVKHKRSVLKIVLEKPSLIHRLNFVRRCKNVNNRHLIGMKKIWVVRRVLKVNIGTFLWVNVSINARQMKDTIQQQKNAKLKRYRNLYVIISNRYGILKLILVKFVQVKLQFGTRLHRNAKNVPKIILFSITQVWNVLKRNVLKVKSGMLKKLNA